MNTKSYVLTAKGFVRNPYDYALSQDARHAFPFDTMLGATAVAIRIVDRVMLEAFVMNEQFEKILVVSREDGVYTPREGEERS